MQETKKKKILCLLPHRPGRSPGQRFRIEQYIPFLEDNGFEVCISNLISEKHDGILYKKGKYLQKFFIFLKTILIRNKDIKRLKDFDIVFIYREAVFHGSLFFERRIARTGIPIIYDFDDSIWLMDISDGNSSLKWLKRPGKVSDIISLSTITLTGNSFLYDFASKYCADVRIIPTTVHTKINIPANKYQKQSEKICIGWTGSSTTLKHFTLAVPFLKEIQHKYHGQIQVIVISDVSNHFEGLEYEFVRWNKDTEIEVLSKIDIGIMPLPDDDWAKGKCGFKGLQYMSLGIPAVLSAVGVNTEIIIDGENGYLATNNNDWLRKLSLLIESAELREKLGMAGYHTVKEKFSYEANKHKWLQAMNDVTSA
jgi:glycosyltransferase involved in cell wall biosynthesis